MRSTKSISCLLIILMILVLSCKNSHPVDKKEALNNVKILNSDIINFVHRSSERPGIKALEFLIKQASAPLPFLYDTSHGLRLIKNFSFAANKGIYCWDTASMMFQKKKDTSLILIRFPMPGNMHQECSFLLYDFAVGKTRSKPRFPVKIQASLLIGEKEVFIISHHASINESMISSIKTEIKSDSTEFSLSFSREGSFADKSGELIARLRLLEGRIKILKSTLKCDIDYHPPLSYSYRKISIEQNLFSTELKGTIDYGSINPTSNQYDQEFNKYTHLELIDSEDDGIIGNIVLSPVGKDGRYDYFIRFSDGSETRLKDQLLVLKKLLNSQN